jgi:hypothetical protein
MGSLLKKHEWKYLENFISPFREGDGPTNMSINYFSEKTHYNVYIDHVQCQVNPDPFLFEFECEGAQWRIYRE